MRDELRLFEQTVPDVGTVLSFPISLTHTKRTVRTPGRPRHQADEEICLMKY